MLAPLLQRPLRFVVTSRVLSRTRYLSHSGHAHKAEAYLEPLESNSGISYLYLNRPQTKNAISVRLLSELMDCLNTAKHDSMLRVLIVRSSTPDSFCAGADLIERRSMNEGQVAKFLSDLREAFSALESLPIPTIAAIDGPALGGGLEMGLCCDLRVAGHNVTKIGLPETKLGIIPGAGGTQRAARLLGVSKAKELIFTGRMLTASEAERWGIVDYVSEINISAADRAVQLAKEIVTSAPLALRAAKLAISRAPELSIQSGLDFERACYQPLLSTKDRMEALEAFRAKRKPIFRGE